MAYSKTAWSKTTQNITSAVSLVNSVIDASEAHMVICSIYSSGFHTDRSTHSITVYVGGYKVNGQSVTRIKPAGETSVWYQLEPIFVPANTALRIDIESDNTNDSSVNFYGTIFQTQQSDMRYLFASSQSTQDLQDFADAGYNPSTHKVQGVVLTDTTTDVTNEVTTDAASRVLSTTSQAAVVAAVEAALVNDGDATALLQAIADKFTSEFDIEEITLSAVASAVATAILATPSNKLATGSSGEVTTDTASRTASKATGFSTHNAADVKTAIEADGSKLTLIKAVIDNLPNDGALTDIATFVAKLTDARMQVLTDLIDDGRLDVLLDTAAAGGNAPTVEEIDTRLSGTHGAGAWTDASGSGSGANSVTLTVNDGTDPLESAKVRVTKGALSYLATTNVSGEASFSLDDGTWTVAITLAGYTFTATTIVVNGVETETYSMTAVAFTASEVDKITGYWYTYDEDCEIEASVTVQIRAVTISGTGTVNDGDIRTEVSSAIGLLQVTNLIPGATYEARRYGSTTWSSFTIDSDAATPYALPNVLG